nr:MAG TPA: replicative helicase [Ackermannviridae sp.]
MDYFVNAMLHWKERYKDRITHIYFETMQPSILRREIKKKVRQGFRHFVYDTFKADEEEYKDIIELSKVADNLTKRFNITFTITLQLAGESYGTKYLTYKCLARAKAIKEILENLIMFRKLDKEELVNLIVMKHNEETGKEEEVSFRMDIPYYAVFCDKNRNGRDGYVLLYYIDLDTLYYEEIGVIQNMPKDTSRKKSS